MFHSLYVRKHVFSLLSVMLMSLAAAGLPGLQSQALAQNRTLPDFTDLVEQVGPSVVSDAYSRCRSNLDAHGSTP
jgi:hypothetical protein